MRPTRRTPQAVLATTLIVVAATTATAPTAGATSGPARSGGTLVLIGGALKPSNDKVYDEIISRAGGSSARIGILTAASVPESQDPDAGDPDKCSNSACNGAYYAGLFKSHGAAEAAWIPIDLDHIANADSDAVVAQVNAMTGFFFGGGDQYRYLTSLMHGERHTDSKVLAAIRAKLAAGAVVAGTSAGAQIAAGRDMVTGGDSYQALRDGSAPGYFDDPAKLGYIPAGGFGFLNSGLIDTHTGTNGREGRSLRLAADTGHDRVFALDEDTALVVEHAGTRRETMHVTGTRGVTVLDLRHADSRTTTAGWTLSNARYTYLTDGDKYDPRAWKAEAGADKKRLTPTGTSPVPINDDVFYSIDNAAGTPYSLLGTARALAANRVYSTARARTYESAPRFTVSLTKRPTTRSYTGDGTAATTVVGLRLDIAPQQR
ncbi:cyanophycinase [Yinghuangia soli]|uniref:Cyanophycinase n=1 Tax=Yinghuangia soli TaxID=2908204 RepID=A0AA41U374_9ACTN|nr:cyanophycinase [Yinghuangia soli]MCF2531525.1 cyanophycinase [Yinghuangia soli]